MNKAWWYSHTHMLLAYIPTNKNNRLFLLRCCIYSTNKCYNANICWHYNNNKQEKCHACLCLQWKSFITSGPEFKKLFPCSSQLNTKFILLINVKNCWHFHIYLHVNTTSERLKERNFFICRYFSFFWVVEISCSVELSMKKKIITAGPVSDRIIQKIGFLSTILILFFIKTYLSGCWDHHKKDCFEPAFVLYIICVQAWDKQQGPSDRVDFMSVFNLFACWIILHCRFLFN